jgi:hypothetical protein
MRSELRAFRGLTLSVAGGLLLWAAAIGFVRRLLA